MSQCACRMQMTVLTIYRGNSAITNGDRADQGRTIVQVHEMALWGVT